MIQFDSPDDEHWVARNMQRSEINKYIEKSGSSWLSTRIVQGNVNFLFSVIGYQRLTTGSELGIIGRTLI
jgi:hypothetical protein